MRFAVNPQQGLAGSMANLGYMLGSMPAMKQQWANQAYDNELKQRGMMAELGLKEAHRAKYEQDVTDARAAQERGTTPNLLKNALRAQGVLEYQVGDLAGFAQTGQMPGQYVQPPADLGGGPALPTPDIYNNGTISKAMQMMGLTGNAMAMGDKNSSNVAESVGRMQDQGLIEQALGMQSSGNMSGMNAINAVRKGTQFEPYAAVGETGTVLNKMTGAQPVGSQAIFDLFGGKVNSMIRENNAQAGAAGASAGASNALRLLRGTQNTNAKIQGGMDAIDFEAAQQGAALPSTNRASRGADSTNAATDNKIYQTMMKDPAWSSAPDAEFQTEFARRASLAPSRQGANPAKAAPKQSGGMPQVKTRAEAMALPKGTRFLDPDGVERVR